MDSFLLYKDSTTEGKKGYFAPSDIIKDLNLDIVFRTMSGGDDWIADKVRKIVLIPLKTPEDVRYRHQVTEDLLNCSELLQSMADAAQSQERALQIYKTEMDRNRMRSTRKTGEILETLNYLKSSHSALVSLRDLLEEHRGEYHSEALTGLSDRLGEMPLDEIGEKLQELDYFVTGGKIGYTLHFGAGMKIREIVVRYSEHQERTKKKKIQGNLDKLYYNIFKKNSILLREEELQKDVSHVKEVVLGHLLKLFQPYREDLMHFWEYFAEEMAFYCGSVRLMVRLKELSLTLTMPEPKPVGTRDTHFEDLYELSMAIYVQRKPIGNRLDIKDNLIMLITGANQGGKSTFLRSFGIAQVLMQCGMAVPAAYFSAPLRPQIFTHFTRQEDEQLNSGRLCEELKRMSAMVDAAVPDSLFLLNESFASTTEKEGTQIARGILQAFYEKGITTFMVTHLYLLAESLYSKKIPGTVFLTAERREDGGKTYHMLEGKSEHTSYGMDLFAELEI